MQRFIDQVKTNGFYIGLLSDILIDKKSAKFNALEFFTIFLVNKDTNIIVENTENKISSGNVAFVGPHKKVEFDINSIDSIYLIVFTKDFFDNSSKESIYLKSHLFFNRNSHVYISPQCGNDEFKKIILIERLAKFSSTSDRDIFNSAVYNTIECLILDAYLHTENQETSIKTSNSLTSVANKFTTLLQRDFKKEKTVSYYANELNVSNRKLNMITEAIFGKSAKQVIIDKLAKESEKLIKSSKTGFSEIALDLGFKDEGNFSNFVKKHLGKKPTQIREKI